MDEDSNDITLKTVKRSNSSEKVIKFPDLEPMEDNKNSGLHCEFSTSLPVGKT